MRSQKLKIVLIDTSLPTDELNEPLGVEVLAGELTHRFGEKIDVCMLSLSLDKIEVIDYDWLKKVDLVGISTKIGSYDNVKQILRQLSPVHSSHQRPLVILGGVVATFGYEQILMEQRDVVCIIGEGEDALSGIVELMLENEDTPISKLKSEVFNRTIPNIAICINQSVLQSERKLVDLAKCESPRRDLLNEVVVRGGIVRVEGSRGCSWGHCSFCCVNSKYGSCRWRPFDERKVIREIVALSHAGVKMIYFTDEDFIGESHERVQRLAGKIVSLKDSGEICKEMAFFVSMSVKSLLPNCGASDEEMIRTLTEMRMAGFREIFLGIESGCDRQLARYRKGVTSQDNLRALKILKSLGFYVDIGFLMFDPEMTLDDLKENISFLEDADLIGHDSRLIKRLRAIPHTNLINTLTVKGLLREQLDIDSLQFPMQFASASISRMVSAFQQWENLTLKTVNVIQGCLRGQEAESVIRADLRAFLGELRRLDFELLMELITLEENNGLKDGGLVERCLARYLERFNQHCSQVDYPGSHLSQRSFKNFGGRSGL